MLYGPVLPFGFSSSGSASSLEPRAHIGEHQLNRLMLRDRLAKGRALLRIADGVVEGRLPDPDCPRRDIDPPHFERAHHFTNELIVECIQYLRTIERDESHMPARFSQNKLIGHVASGVVQIISEFSVAV